MSALMSVTLLTTIVSAMLLSKVSSTSQSSRGNHLSTFRTENLKIRSPARRFSSVIDEAIWLMRNHFLKRQVLSRKDWETLPSEYAGYNDVNKAMEDLMRRFNDPYSRHIPESVMMVRQRGIRGEAVGIGVVLKRKWHWNELGRAVRGLFLAPSSNFTIAESSIAVHPVLSAETIPQGNIYSNILTLLKSKNRRISDNLSQNYYVQHCSSLLQHFTTTLQTAAPFVLAVTCQRMKMKMFSKVPWNVNTIKILSVGAGLLHILRKVAPVIFPIEVVSLQSGGPSVLSGVEIGDQIYFVDGQVVNSLSLKRVNEMLTDGEVGDIVNVGIIRNFENSPAVATSSLDRRKGSRDEEGQGTAHTQSEQCEKKKNKGFISLDITRDNVFSSKVSSRVLSFPTYTPYRTTAKAKTTETALNTDLVASADALSGDASSGYDGAMGYISIGEFTQRTLFEVEAAIEAIRSQLLAAANNPKLRTRKTTPDSSTTSASDIAANSRNNCKIDALVIDLRGNLGGTLPSALDAASLFLPQGRVLLQMKSMASPAALALSELAPHKELQKISESAAPKGLGLFSSIPGAVRSVLSFSQSITGSSKDRTESYYSTLQDADSSTPLLLLVDSQTASASEIFVAALVDNNRATCMGSRTVGKNVAQAIMMLSDGSGLVFTVREFLGPQGRYMGHGITPNILVQDPRKLDLSKIRYNTISKKWTLHELSFSDNCSNIFQ